MCIRDRCQISMLSQSMRRPIVCKWQLRGQSSANARNAVRQLVPIVQCFWQSPLFKVTRRGCKALGFSQRFWYPHRQNVWFRWLLGPNTFLRISGRVQKNRKTKFCHRLSQGHCVQLPILGRRLWKREQLFSTEANAAWKMLGPWEKRC